MGLSEENKKKLISLIEIGVERSSERLGKISNTKWDISTGSTKEISTEKFLIAANAGKTNALGVRLGAKEGIRTDMAIFFPETSARAIAREMLRDHAWGMKKLDNVLELATGEISNILGQSIIGAIADECETAITLSVPQVTQGTKEELLCAFFSDCEDPSKVLFMSHVELYSGALSATCSMVALFDSLMLEKGFSSKSQT